MFNTLTSWLRPSPRGSRRRGKAVLNSIEQLESRIAPDATPHLLSGGPLTQNWSNTGLITVNNDWSGVPSIQGFSGADLTSVNDVNPQTVVADETTPTVTANSTLTENTGNGLFEFHITNPTVALAGGGTHNAPSLVFTLNTTGMEDIQVQYNLRDLTVSAGRDTASQFALQYRIGNSGNYTNVPAGYVADATLGGSATLVTPVSVTLPAAVNNQPLVQVRVITTNASGTDEWVGVDDIVISGTSNATAETEPNDTRLTAQVVPVAVGDVITTPVEDWTTIAGSISSGSDQDFFSFTLTSAAGVFFDIDSRDTGLSTTLNSILTLFDGSGATLATNDDGYDFQGFAVPDAGGGNGLSPDSSLYFDLAAGTYTIRVQPFNATSIGSYELRILADTIYSSSVPVLNSNPGASDTLFLDFDGHAATDGWGTYTAVPYDLNSNPSNFSPAERLAIFNIWQMIGEDYSPFALNVSTVTPGSFGNGVGFRQVITNSDPSIAGQASGTLGVAFLNSYAGGGENVAFTFAAGFSYLGTSGGISGDIVAYPVEIGNTTSHEFGHALSLDHYRSSTSPPPPADVIPGAIMATPDFGLNRERWATGTNENGVPQDDMAVISNTTNTFGYRSDDHGSTTGTATPLTATGGTYSAAGIIEQTTDTDYFQFSGFGQTTIRVDVSEYINNLDVVLRLLDSAGNPIATDNPSSSFDASISANLASGLYFVEVSGTGVAGSAGQYTLRIDAIANAPPIVTLPGGPVAYTENGAAIILDGSAMLIDSDSPDFDTGTLTVDFTANGTADDRIEIRDQGAGTGQIGVSGSNVTFGGTTIGTFTGGIGLTPLAVTFNASATPAAVAALLRNLTFRVVSDTPSILPRTVRFVVSDGDGGTSSPATKTVNVSAVNDAPIITLSPGAASYSEGNPATILDAAATVVDPDSPNLETGTLTVDYAANGTADDRLEILTQGSITVSGNTVSFGGTPIGTFTGGDGTTPLIVTLNASATPASVEALVRSIAFRNVSADPSTLPRQVRFVLTDGDGATSTAANKTVNVIGISANPSLSLPGGPATYSEDSPATVLDSAATVADSDSANFDAGSLTVDYVSGASFADRLEIRNQGAGPGQIGVSGSNVTFGGTTIGTFSGGSGATPLVVTFNANAIPAATEALLRSLTFRTISDTPSTATRTVRFVLTDGDGGTSTPVTKTVSVIAVNDPPVVTLPNSAVTYSEGAPPVILDPGATVSDVDSANFGGGNLTVDYAANGTADDRLTIRNQGTGSGEIGVSGTNVTFSNVLIGSFTGGVGTTPLVVTFTSSATPPAVAALVQNILFSNVSTDPSTAPRSVRFVVNEADGAASTPASKTVNVLLFSLPPVVTLPGLAVTYTEDGPGVILDGQATVTDPDTTNFDTGALTVSIVTNATPDDRLEIQHQGTGPGQIGVSGSNISFSGIPIGTFAGGSGSTPLVVTLNANALPNRVEALVRNITFRNVSNNPLTSPRTVQFVLDDGHGGTSTPVTRIVNITAVNDAGVVTLPGTPVTFTEGGSPVLVDGTAVIDDIDSTNFNGGSLTVDHAANGTADDRLAIRNEGSGTGQIGVSGSTVRFGGVIIGSFTGGSGTAPLVVSFTSTAATPAAVTALARNITFSNVSANPSLALRSIRFILNDGDGGTSIPVTQTVNISPVNDNPVMTLPGGAIIYTENDPPTVLDGAAIVVDPDSPNFDTGTLTVSFTANGTADDRIEIRNLGVAAGQIGVSGSNVTFGGVSIGTFTGGTGTTPLVVTFNSASSLAAVQALVRNIAFRNVSDNPNTTPRTVQLSLTDGDGGIASPVSKTVNVVAVNDAPAFTFPGAPATFIEGGPPVLINTSAIVTDPDSLNLSGGTLTVSYAANGTANDVLAINNQGSGPGQIGVSGSNVAFGSVTIGTFTGGGGTTPLVVTFNAASSPAAAEALVRNITFFNGTVDPSPSTRTVRFVLSDGDGGTSDATTTTVNVNSIPDNPVLTLPGAALNYVENDPPTVIDSTATLTDIDSPNFDAGSLAVTLTGNGTAFDRLSIRSQGTGPGQIGISGTDVTFNPGSGAVVIGVITSNGVGLTPLVVTFSSPAATLAAVQALIRTIAFSNVSDTPSTAPRTVRFVVNDGDGGTSNPVTKTISLTQTNEAPILGGAANLAAIDEDPATNPGTLVSALVAGQVTDPDGPASGIAVSAVDDTNGTWQYALDGTTFSPIAPQLAGGNVLLLATDANTRVRFVPNLNFHGTVAGLTLRAWDRSDGSAEGASIAPFPQINPTGSLSDTTAVAGIVVNSVLDTPTVTGATTDEETQTTGGLVINRNPGDGAEVTHFKVTGITGGLLFKNDGTTPVLDGDFLTFAEANAGLKFTPSANLNSANTAFFGFSVQSSSSASDAGLGGGLAVATVTVNPVNDNPVLGAIGGSRIYLAGDVPLLLDDDGTVADLDSPDFDGGSLTVSFAVGGMAADSLAIRNQGTGTGEIGVSGSDVTYEGLAIGTSSGGTGGAPLVVALNANATLAAVQALIRNITFSTSGSTSGGDRTIQFQVADGDGGTSNAPTVSVTVVTEMSVDSIVRDGTSPTPASTVSWTVTFSLPVLGLSASNFTLAGSLAANSTIDSVDGAGTTWTVTATASGSGDGTLGLDFTSEAGLNLTATNEPFVGEVYTLDRTGPTVTFDDGDADDLVAAGITLTYTLTFTEDIDGSTVSAADFENAGDAAITLGTVQITSPTTVAVQVTPTTGGMLRLGLAANASITDVLGNAVIVPTADDTVVAVDATPPGVALIDDGDADNVVAPNDTLTYTIDFAEPIDFSTVGAADFANAGTSAITLGAITSVDADTITVAITPTTPGTLILRVGPDILDIAGNAMGSTALDDDTVVINVSPVARAEEYFGTEDTTLEVDAATGLLANDTDANDPVSSLTVDTTPVTAPANGDLTLNADGSFSYTPDPDFNGVDSFTYRVRDPNGGGHTATVTLTIGAINDAPTIAVPAAPVTVNEDAGLQIIPNFATGITTGPANESAQVIASLVVTVISTTGNLAFSGNPSINPATGALSFLTAPDTNGTATVQVTVTDSGSNVSPNINATSRTFTITVTPVNDPPSFQIPGFAPTVFEDTGTQTVPGFATNFHPGPVSAGDEVGQAPSYLVTVTATSGGLTFSVQPAIAPDGTLTYTPAPNASGTATVSVQARDSGSTANGGQDTSAPRTFTIFVTPVNDPPTAVDDTATILRGSGPTTINVIANDSIAPDVGESLIGVVAVTQPANGRVTIAGSTVTYEPNNGFVGIDSFQYTVRDSNGGTDTATVTVTVERPPSETPNLIAVGAGPGGGSRVRLYSLPTGSFAAEFSVYDSSFTGAISVAVGDINGDRVPDVIVVPGVGGGPHVKVIDGNKLGLVGPDGRISDAALLGSFFAYDPSFTGGVILSVGDVNGDGSLDIITGTGAGGGAHVKVIDGATIASGSPATLASFFAYQPSFRGGVNVAAGDVNGDGITDVITAAGASGGSHVKAFDGMRLNQAGPGDSNLLASLFAYGAAFLGGVNVAAGDLDGDGRADIITGAGLGGGSHVKVFSGGAVTETASFFAFPGNVGPGVDVAFRAPAGSEGIVVVGAGLGARPRVQTFTGPGVVPTVGFDAFDLGFLGGIDVG